MLNRVIGHRLGLGVWVASSSCLHCPAICGDGQRVTRTIQAGGSGRVGVLVCREEAEAGAFPRSSPASVIVCAWLSACLLSCRHCPMHAAMAECGNGTIHVGRRGRDRIAGEPGEQQWRSHGRPRHR
jgi:hypothetical protein